MAFKTFANGFPLPASDLNNFLMKQSVIVFADEAARTAALSEPTEGMVTYLEDDNELYKWTGAAWENVVPTPDLSSLIPKSTVTTAGDLIIADGASSVTRLGIGAADTVLTSNGTTATWEAAGGGGSLTLLASGSFSGSTLISSISQDYKALKIIFTNIYRSSTFGFQFRNSGTTQNVNYWREQYNGSSWSFDSSGDQATMFFLNFDLNPGNGQFILDLWDYTSTGARQFEVNGSPQSGNVRYVYGGGVIRSASGSAINELNVFVDSGDYEIYGVN